MRRGGATAASGDREAAGQGGAAGEERPPAQMDAIGGGHGHDMSSWVGVVVGGERVVAAIRAEVVALAVAHRGGRGGGRLDLHPADRVLRVAHAAAVTFPVAVAASTARRTRPGRRC